jgi:hypothetical protein
MSSKSHNTSVLVFLLSFVLLSTSICFADSQEDASRKRALIISGVIFGATYVGTIVGVGQFF